MLESNHLTLDRLWLRNFTVFDDADFQFSPGLNLIIGENGTGKSHVLKSAYSIAHTCNQPNTHGADPTPTKVHLQKALADKLIGVFRPDELGRLVRRTTRGRGRCEVECEFSTSNRIGFSFNSTSKKEVAIEDLLSRWIEKLPVFIPTRELLTIYPGFVSLYDNSAIPFEETYRDTCSLLGFPLARGPREKTIKALLEPIEEAMHGKVTNDGGRFYLKESGGASVEIHLVAEGLRKLAMLAQLVATGQLTEQGYLFWDEPEANLNPKFIKTLAKTMLLLSNSGIQLFVATHSLFLMRELDNLLRTREFAEANARFFGLQVAGEGVEVKQGDSIDDVGDIASLQEELIQTDRYLNTGAEDDIPN